MYIIILRNENEDKYNKRQYTKVGWPKSTPFLERKHTFEFKR